MTDDLLATKPAILVENLTKRFGSGATAVEALKGVNMAVFPGEVVGLIGPSGSGKSTLLKCLGAVIEPTAGRITLGGDVTYEDRWTTHDLRALRRDPRTKGIPVVMISGNEQATEQFYVQRIGADDFMKKPFSRAEVFSRIEILLDAASIPRRAAERDPTPDMSLHDATES